MEIFVVIVVLIVLLMVLLPLRASAKDYLELSNTPLKEKISVLIGQVNADLLHNEGNVYVVKKRLVNLISDSRRNLLIQFYYTGGNIVVALNYKYYHEELVHKETFPNFRNPSILYQKDCGKRFAEIASRLMEQHEISVMKKHQSSMPSVNNESSEENQADPTNIMTSLYSGFSIDQKKSVLNMASLILSEGGITLNQQLSHNNLLTLAINLGVNIADCQLVLSSMGENKVVSDLRNLSDSDFEVMIMDILPIVFIPNDERKQSKFYDLIVNKMDYSENRLKDSMEKLDALINLFGCNSHLTTQEISNNSDSDDDAVGIMSRMFSSFSEDQRKSLYNLGSLILSEVGISYNRQLSDANLTTLASYLNVNIADCQYILAANGESKVVSDLRDMSDEDFDLMIMILIPIVYNPQDERKIAKLYEMIHYVNKLIM